jgi:hypothetical protein
MQKKKKRSEYGVYEETSYEFEVSSGLLSRPLAALRAVIGGCVWIVAQSTARAPPLPERLSTGLAGHEMGLAHGRCAISGTVRRPGGRSPLSGGWSSRARSTSRNTMNTGSSNYAAIRRRVVRRYRRRVRIAVHALIFLGLNLTAWLSFWPHRLYTPSYSTPLPFTVFTLILLLIHAAVLLVGEAEESAVEREIDRQRWASGDDLRERQARLSDDGELIYFHGGEDEPKRKRDGERAGGP